MPDHSQAILWLEHARERVIDHAKLSEIMLVTETDPDRALTLRQVVERLPSDTEAIDDAIQTLRRDARARNAILWLLDLPWSALRSLREKCT